MDNRPLAVAPVVEAPRAIAAPAAPAAPPRKIHAPRAAEVKSVRPQQKPEAKAAAPAAPGTPRAAASDAEEKVVATLRKGEKTSREIIDATGLEPGTVYYVLDKLRSRGSIETFEVEGSVYRKNRLVAA